MTLEMILKLSDKVLWTPLKTVVTNVETCTMMGPTFDVRIFIVI